MPEKSLPLIVTLKLDEASQQYFSELRKAHYPAHVNYIDAHLTLFHRLPSNKTIITDALAALNKYEPFSMEVTGIRNMGKGVAFTLKSRKLHNLHIELQQKFTKFLIRKDRQILWPHITVQNQVTANKAQKLFEQLNTDFKPFIITAAGISTWLYQKGPWEHEGDYLFPADSRK